MKVPLFSKSTFRYKNCSLACYYYKGLGQSMCFSLTLMSWLLWCSMCTNVKFHFDFWFCVHSNFTYNFIPNVFDFQFDKFSALAFSVIHAFSKFYAPHHKKHLVIILRVKFEEKITTMGLHRTLILDNWETNRNDVQSALGGITGHRWWPAAHCNFQKKYCDKL